MAKADICMFCGNAPCTCGKPAKAPVKKRAPKAKAEPKEAAPPKAKPEPVPLGKPKPDAMAAMKARAAKGKPATAAIKAEPEPVKFVPKTPDRTKDETEEFNRAIRALGSIMAPSEKAKYSSILNAEPSVPEATREWKERQRERTEGNA